MNTKHSQALGALVAIICILIGSHAGAANAYAQAEPGGIINGQRPLLIIFYTEHDGEPLAHSESEYVSMVFGTVGLGGPTVSEYFQAISRSQFRYRDVGTVTVIDDKSDETNLAARVDPMDEYTAQKRKRARYLAGKNGFDYAAYDLDADGIVTTEELTILVVENPVDSDDGGQTGGEGPCAEAGAVEVCSAVSLVGHETTLMNIAHELTHTLEPSAFDLYGSNCLSQGATVMACTAGGPFSDVSANFMDPYHRSLYRWAGRSETYDQASPPATEIVLYGVDNPWGHLELASIRNAATNETLMLELRGVYARYDDRVDGLLAWYAKLNDDGFPVAIPRLKDPASSDDLVKDDDPKDASVFVLAPTAGCALDANQFDGRGRVKTLDEGRYTVRWADGTGTTLRLARGTYLGDQPTWRISYAPADGATNECAL